MKRLANLALLAYPLAYRRRYGEEMQALLDDAPADGRAVVDLFRGALIAHLRPAPGCGLVAEDRLRLGVGGVLACWAAFVVAGLAFYKSVEGYPFSAAGEAHPALGASYLSVQIAAVVASIAVVVGAALRRAPRLVVAAGIVVTAAMLAIVGAVALYAISLSGLPLAGEGNGPGGLISVELSLVFQLAAMIALAALATLSSVRGWRALGTASRPE
jgi:hypothetical protein